MEKSSKECTQGSSNTRLVPLLDQTAVIPPGVSYFNNKAFDMVGIFLFSWQEQQKYLLPTSLYLTPK